MQIIESSLDIRVLALRAADCTVCEQDKLYEGNDSLIYRPYYFVGE